eukprot:7810619-Ditylum_brightwellii.AAC.1
MRLQLDSPVLWHGFGLDVLNNVELSMLLWFNAKMEEERRVYSCLRKHFSGCLGRRIKIGDC